jgi:triacylglycerol lipase
MRFVARELVAYAQHGALGALPRRAKLEGGGPAILFVHGHGGGAGVFGPLERALARRGHRRFVSWDYRSRGTVEELARALARDAGALEGEVHVIGHSLGGIVARLWLQELGGRRVARSLVTLSTPHRGLAAIPGARALPLVRELVAPSPLLERLDRGASALDGLPGLAIVSSRDHFVRSWQSAGFGAARVVPVSGVGHVGVLFDPTVHDLVAEHLERVGSW